LIGEPRGGLADGVVNGGDEADPVGGVLGVLGALCVLEGLDALEGLEEPGEVEEPELAHPVRRRMVAPASPNAV